MNRPNRLKSVALMLKKTFLECRDMGPALQVVLVLSTA